MIVARQSRRMSTSPARADDAGRRSAQRGVTLIEVLVVLGIAAVLLAFGVPAFQEFVTRRRLEGVAQELMTSLQVARSEAMRRGAQVTVRLKGADGSGNWTEGWTMFVDANGSGSIDTGDEVIREGMALPAPLAMHGSASFGTFMAFRADGRLTNAGGGYLVLCQGGELAAGGRSRSRAVLVNGAGRVRMAALDGSGVPVTDTGALTSCTNP